MFQMLYSLFIWWLDHVSNLRGLERKNNVLTDSPQEKKNQKHNLCTKMTVVLSTGCEQILKYKDIKDR